VLGYGIEVNFVLKDEVWDYFYSSITTARTRGGSANVLGILYDDDSKFLSPFPDSTHPCPAYLF
jgi:hypothetical protein